MPEINDTPEVEANNFEIELNNNDWATGEVVFNPSPFQAEEAGTINTFNYGTAGHQLVEDIFPTGEGIMEQVENSTPTYYTSAYQSTVERMERLMLGLKNDPFGEPSPKKKKYIKEDEAMSMKDMKPLEQSEIDKAVWVDNPDMFFLKELKKDRDGSSLIGIGGIGILSTPIISRPVYIILGHRIGDVNYYNNIDSKNALKLSTNKNSSSYILYNVNENKIELQSRNYIDNSWNTASVNNVKSILNRCKFLIKDSVLSGKVFGLGKVKAEMIGNIVEGVIFESGESVRLKGTTWYAVIQGPKTGNNIKFCLADLELILPSVKGYNFPKCKTIGIGSRVIFKNKLDYRDNKTEYIVQEVYPNPTSKKLCKNSETRALDVLRLVSTDEVSPDHRKVYAKNVKLLN